MTKGSIARMLLAALVVTATSCSTVTVRDKSAAKIALEPDYEDSKSFFFWGLVNTQYVNAVEVCHGKPARQLQAQFTFVDSLLTFLTIGIYSPRTAKVWCDRGEQGGRT